MDPNMLAQMSNREREHVTNSLNELQVQSMMDTYNGLVERCFGECVQHFRTKNLDGTEEECLRTCVAKSLSFTQRLQQRFAEKNMQKMGN
mmetsp:Transcript_29982/g.71984  ORF Transcript_29982/g.71984 Transcript_29982/m.71984 type:complete len:90 (-) Transcript_29982:83-352(-)